jgi:hypothetical protein
MVATITSASEQTCTRKSSDFSIERVHNRLLKCLACVSGKVCGIYLVIVGLWRCKGERGWRDASIRADDRAADCAKSGFWVPQLDVILHQGAVKGCAMHVRAEHHLEGT